MAKIKRSLIKSFLNTGSLVSPTWSLIGEGVKTGKMDMGAKVTEEVYIHQVSGTVTVDSYAPKMAVDMIAIAGDAVFAYLDALRKGRSILSDAETEVVNVWLYETPAGGYYYAEKQSVSLSVEDFGGDGGTPARINYTLNYQGDPILGVFKPAATATWEALPVTTILTTLACSGVTLSPLFATDHSNLLYTASVANAVTSTNMTSTLSGATIVQKVGADVVNQGAGAALAVGLNHLTVEVTVGSAVSTYRIDITRAA